MTDSWEPRQLAKDYATTDQVAEVAGVERGALYGWARVGLLPRPSSTGGRGITSKWPLITLKIAEFVRQQRDDGFGLAEIRPRIVAAFGERILDVLAEPDDAPGPEPARPTKKKKRTTKVKR